MLLLGAPGRGLPLAQRPQLLDLPPQADELLAVHARLLQLAEDLLVDLLDIFLARLPLGAHQGDTLVGACQRLFQVLRDSLELDVERFEDAVQALKDLLSGQILDRLGGEEHAVHRDLALQGLETFAE